jgi:hypothetical protein
MQTTESILKTYGLDFKIEKQPLFGKNKDGGDAITPYFGLFNGSTGECINTCKAGYTVSQNKDIVEMILQGIKKYGSKLTVSKAGSINGGRRVYIQLKVEGLGKVGDDNVIKYITVIDSNDGSTSLAIGIGDINMWCENQFFRFYKEGEAKFRHTATIEQKIASIPTLIETALDKSLKQIKLYNKFLSTSVSKELANKMVKEILGYDKLHTSPDKLNKLTTRSLGMMDTLYADIETEIKHTGNNLWSLLSGVTRYTTYHQGVPKRENGQMESMLIGESYKKNNTAFDFCVAQLT